MLTISSLQHIFDSVKQSLERLQLDHIDVLQCTLSETFKNNYQLAYRYLGHRFDSNTPIEEIVSSSCADHSSYANVGIDARSS